MSALPRHWGRLLRAAGLLVALSAVPLWSNAHPVVGVLALAAGFTLSAVRSETMLDGPRLWSRARKFTGAMASVSPVLLWIDFQPAAAVPVLVAGITIVALGSLLVPSIDTGVHIARSSERTALGGEVVIPPEGLRNRFDD